MAASNMGAVACVEGFHQGGLGYELVSAYRIAVISIY
jgi:hypothetical protein